MPLDAERVRQRQRHRRVGLVAEVRRLGAWPRWPAGGPTGTPRGRRPGRARAAARGRPSARASSQRRGRWPSSGRRPRSRARDTGRCRRPSASAGSDGSKRTPAALMSWVKTSPSRSLATLPTNPAVPPSEATPAIVLAADPPETSMAPRTPTWMASAAVAIDERHRALVEVHAEQVVDARLHEDVDERRTDAHDVERLVAAEVMSSLGHAGSVPTHGRVSRPGRRSSDPRWLMARSPKDGSVRPAPATDRRVRGRSPSTGRTRRPPGRPIACRSMAPAPASARPIAPDEPYRLPRTLSPRHYRLTIDVDLAGACFSGSEELELVVHAETDRVVMQRGRPRDHAMRPSGPRRVRSRRRSSSTRRTSGRRSSSTDRSRAGRPRCSARSRGS